MTTKSLIPNRWKAVVSEREVPLEFAQRYLRHVGQVLARIDCGTVANLFRALQELRAQGGTLFIIGNGGSAATSAHMANDLVIGTRKTHKELPALRAISLADNHSLLTAVANDAGFENVFIAQLEVLFEPGDALVAISASGNSPNVVRAAEWVRGQGGTVLGLLGFDGGRLRGFCDVAVLVPTMVGEYGPVEDAHMVLTHLVTEWLKEPRE